MGKGSDELAADVNKRRRAIKQDVTELQRRIDDDLSAARDELADAREKVAGKTAVAGEHPKAAIGGAAAAGFVLGRITGRKRHEGSHHPEQDRDEADSSSPGPLGKVARKGAMAATGFAQAELSAVVRDIWKGKSGGGDGRHGSDGMDPSRPPDVRTNASLDDTNGYYHRDATQVARDLHAADRSGG